MTTREFVNQWCDSDEMDLDLAEVALINLMASHNEELRQQLESSRSEAASHLSALKELSSVIRRLRTEGCDLTARVRDEERERCAKCPVGASPTPSKKEQPGNGGNAEAT